MAYFLLIIGFVFLVKGADYFVSGSSAIAEYFNISAFIIGLTVVAMGTSLPEAAISVTAAMTGANGIALGNAIGSNMFNILVVLGVSAIIRECPVLRETLRFDYPLSIGVAALLVIMSGGLNLDNTKLGGNTISSFEGIILLAIFILFMIVTVARASKNEMHELEIDYYGGADVSDPAACIVEEGELVCADEEASASKPLIKTLFLAVIGAIGVILGGDMVVDSAVKIAGGWGIDEVLIGLTIVALGTSLPELVISIVAARKGETDIAVGNVIGSNIFNLLLVLGLSATIHPIEVTIFSIYDLLILIAVSLIILIPLLRKQALTRNWGVVMLLMYGLYLTYIIMRAM